GVCGTRSALLWPNKRVKPQRGSLWLICDGAYGKLLDRIGLIGSRQVMAKKWLRSMVMHRPVSMKLFVTPRVKYCAIFRASVSSMSMADPSVWAGMSSSSWTQFLLLFLNFLALKMGVWTWW